MLLMRTAWFWYLVQMSLNPLALLVFVYLLWDNPQAAQFAVTGSLVVTMSSSAMLSLGQHVGWMKETNAYEHYAALPVSRKLLVAAIATRGVLLALPSILIVALIGHIALDVRITVLGAVILILGAYAMSGLGAFVGFWSKDARMASMATQVLATIIIFLAPVYIPLEQMPGFLRYTAMAIPTTYVARALRLSAAGGGLSALWPDLTVLLGLALISLLLVPLRLPWRRS
jgi:ABC-2 type transport system permease protein